MLEDQCPPGLLCCTKIQQMSRHKAVFVEATSSFDYFMKSYITNVTKGSIIIGILNIFLQTQLKMAGTSCGRRTQRSSAKVPSQSPAHQKRWSPAWRARVWNMRSTSFPTTWTSLNASIQAARLENICWVSWHLVITSPSPSPQRAEQAS